MGGTGAWFGPSGRKGRVIWIVCHNGDDPRHRIHAQAPGRVGGTRPGGPSGPEQPEATQVFAFDGQGTYFSMFHRAFNCTLPRVRCLPMRRSAHSPTGAHRAPASRRLRARPKLLETAFVLVVLSLFVTDGMTAQEPATTPSTSSSSVEVQLRVLDSRSLEPVEGALVRLAGTSHQGLTNSAGRLNLPDVRPAQYDLLLEHLAYGEHRRPVDVDGESVFRLDIRLSQQALALDPIVVEGRRRVEWPTEGRGTSVRLIPREVIEQFEGTGASLGDLIRARLPGLNVHETPGMASQGACIESRRTSTLVQANRCRMALVLMDRVPVNQPATLLAGMPLHHIESVEFLSPGEAGVRYGSDAGNGVLLITSRRPDALPKEGERGGWRYPTYDWSTEEGNHPWMSAVMGAMAGNAVGLALSRPGRACVSMDVGLGALCGQSPSTEQGIAGFLLPVVGASLGAQLMGRTDESAGSLRTTLIVSAAALAVAYTVTTASNQHPITTGQRIGHGLVLVGVPVSAGLADRYFRSLRTSSDPASEPR